MSGTSLWAEQTYSVPNGRHAFHATQALSDAKQQRKLRSAVQPRANGLAVNEQVPYAGYSSRCAVQRWRAIEIPASFTCL